VGGGWWVDFPGWFSAGGWPLTQNFAPPQGIKQRSSPRSLAAKRMETNEH